MDALLVFLFNKLSITSGTKIVYEKPSANMKWIAWYVGPFCLIKQVSPDYCLSLTVEFKRTLYLNVR